MTGGGTGIGKAIASAFFRDGNEVVITGRRPAPLAATATELGPSVRAVRFDAADPAQVQPALPDLPETVDVLVNNAGGNTDIGAPEPDSLVDVAAAWRIDGTEFFRDRMTEQRRSALIAQTASGRQHASGHRRNRAVPCLTGSKSHQRPDHPCERRRIQRLTHQR